MSGSEPDMAWAHGQRRLLSRLEIAEPLAQPLSIMSKFVEMALGCKLAAPDKMVVQVVGDGGFYFGERGADPRAPSRRAWPSAPSTIRSSHSLAGA
jgi:hypothetical protein